MTKKVYSPHPFDQNEYFSGQRFVLGGVSFDWDDIGHEEDSLDVAVPGPQVVTVRFESAEGPKGKKRTQDRTPQPN